MDGEEVAGGACAEAGGVGGPRVGLRFNGDIALVVGLVVLVGQHIPGIVMGRVTH